MGTSEPLVDSLSWAGECRQVAWSQIGVFSPEAVISGTWVCPFLCPLWPAEPCRCPSQPCHVPQEDPNSTGLFLACASRVLS